MSTDSSCAAGNSRSQFRINRQRRWLLEKLEDRTLPSVAPAGADLYYDLEGSLADQHGGPALIADGGVLDNGRYHFGASQGLRLAGALADTSTYSVVLSLNIDSGSFFKKLIDFQDRLSDDGLYLSGASLQLYPGPSAPAFV